MIEYSIPIKLKYYLFGNLYQIRYSFVERFFLALFLGCLVYSIIFKQYLVAVLAILIPLAVNILFPIIRYLVAKYSHSANNVTYFFKSDSFGFKIGDFKVEIDKSAIKSIARKNRYLLIKTNKQKQIFLGEKEDLDRVHKQLLKSDYQKFFI
jgi:hypothetical protein